MIKTQPLNILFNIMEHISIVKNHQFTEYPSCLYNIRMLVIKLNQAKSHYYVRIMFLHNNEKINYVRIMFSLKCVLHIH